MRRKELFKKAMELKGVRLQKATKQEVLEMYNVVYKKAQELKRETIYKLKKQNLPLPAILRKGSPYTKPFRKMSGKESIGRIKSEFKRVISFLSDKTSTFGGAKDVVRDFISRVLKQGEVDTELSKLTDEQYKKFWEIYNKVDVILKDKPIYYNSTQIQEDLYEIVVQNDDSMTVDEIIEKLEDRLRMSYEESFDNEEDEDL